MKRHLSVLLAGLLFSAAANGATADSNGNGMSDAWEKRFNNGQLLAPTFLPENDDDGDGISNLDECNAGTDPFDGVPPEGFLQAEVLHVAAVYTTSEGGGEPEVLTPEAFVISWPTRAGKLYTLQCSPDLSPGSWLPVGEPEYGEGREIQIATLPTYPDGTVADKFFWRVAVTDTDSDGDGFNDYDEYLKGTGVMVADRDDDGLPDAWEILHELDPDDDGTGDPDKGCDGDPDGDGLTNIVEYGFGTDPQNADTDTDGLSDSEEMFLTFTNPIRSDTDNDGVTDGMEDFDWDGLTNSDELHTHHTDPWDFDTDLDTLIDGWEVAHGFDPLVADSVTDPDGDGLTNFQEQRLGLDPLDDDTDGNGITDGAEDPDGDALSNLAELNTHQTHPLKADTDNDTLSDSAEIITHLTDPTKHDTDDDGLPDGWEIQHALNPKSTIGIHGGTGDPDSDGLDNFHEWLNGCDPRDADSDDDGADDLTEVNQGSDPNDPSDDGNPPEEAIQEVEFKAYGDYASWRMEIHGEGPRDHRTQFVVTPAVGVPETGVIKLRRNNKYRVTLHHTGSKPGEAETWYCWEARVGDLPWQETFPSYGPQRIPGVAEIFTIGDGHWLVDNRDGLFTTHNHRNESRGGNVAEDLEAVLHPIEVSYIGRDPDTGVSNNLGGVVESSEPRPLVVIDNANASINSTGNLEVAISGKAREYVSELLASGEGAVASLEVFLDGELVDTITDLPAASGGAPIRQPWLRRDSTVTFSKTITVPDLVPGLHNLVVKSNENAMGLQGWDGVSLLVEKKDYNGIPLQNAPTFSIVLNGDLTSAADSITLQSNGSSAILSEVEGGESSGSFTGQMDFGGVPRQIQVQLSPLLSLNAGGRETLTGEVSWQDGAGGMNAIQTVWKETTDTSKQFATVTAHATVESWSNLQITKLTHDDGSSGGEMNPFVVRFQTSDDFDPFGASGILSSTLNGETVEFKEASGLLDQSPPQGMRWFYLHAGNEPRVFCLNEKLAGGVHSPAQVLADGEIRLDFHVIADSSQSIKDKATANRPYELPGSQDAGTAGGGVTAAPAPPTGGTPAPAPEAAEAEAFTMADIRFWFEFFFEDAGMNLLTRYEAGTSEDSGLTVSLVNLWPIDGRSYAFDGTLPENMATGTNPKPAALWLNKRKIKTPIDGAVALFTALQQLRSEGDLSKRSGLVVDWTEILDTYLNGESPDEDVEKALRQSKLGPLSDTLGYAKSAYEVGFSFVPGGELVITANDVDNALVEGNTSAAVVAVGVWLAPNVLKKTIKYAKRTLRTVKLNLKSAGVTNWTVRELEILYEAGVGKRISRIDKMESLRPHIESGELVLDDTKINALRSNLKYDQGGIDLGISPDNSRAILRKQLNMTPGSKLEAHHDLPICAKDPDLEKEFLKRGIDPNKGEHGRPLEIEKHKLIHGKGCTGWGDYGDPYIYQWDRFFRDPDRNPINLQKIREFRDELRQLTSQEFKNADELTWPYPKP